MDLERWFLERRQTWELSTAAPWRQELSAGAAEERLTEARVTHRHWALDPWGEGHGLPPELRSAHLTAREQPAPVAEALRHTMTAMAERFTAAATRAGARGQLQLRQVQQQVTIAADGVNSDLRQFAILEAQLSFTGASGKPVTVQRERAAAGLAGLAGVDLEALAHQMGELVRGRAEARPVEPGPLTVVIPPGADAGVFFHEVCGHPLEGDVVERGGSYLARRLGEQVAPPFVTVADNPTTGHGCCYAIDDEGNPARPALLVNAGKVFEPLLDGWTASGRSARSNGHGRRVSFHTPAIPRMSHTELRPHQGSLAEIVSEVERGLLVRYLTPRHVHLLSGDFSFFVVEAQEIRGGKVGAFVGPCVLRGNGLTALAGIDAVGADLEPFFGLKGCGKLDHGPLPVSFGNPTVRLRSLWVTPWN